MRLFPRDDERQESAVTDFWGYLLAGERPGSLPILARYDGQRPLVPWLIRVFQNRHCPNCARPRAQSAARRGPRRGATCYLPAQADGRWHEEFREAARGVARWAGGRRVLLLGLRLRTG